MNSHFWWYVARSSGIVAWLMLTASVLWGVMLSTKAFAGWRRPAWLLDLHRWLGGLTVAFVLLHMGALIADNYVHFDLVTVMVPFTSGWRRVPVALGVLAAWMVFAVQVTSLAVVRLSKRTWRIIHMSGYLAFLLTSIHAAAAGTDTGSALYKVTAAASIVMVAWATMYRIANRRSVTASPRSRSSQLITGPGSTTPSSTSSPAAP